MPQKRKPDQSKLIAEAALSVADKTGWAALSMKDVARKAKLSQSAVEKRFRDKWQILKWVLEDVAAETAKDVKSSLTDSWRDNLFEILMTRFEIAQRHRGAFYSLPHVLPQVVPRFAPLFYGYMNDMLKLAKAPATPLHTAAFGAVYVSVVHAWIKDETHDLAKTMAAVDKRLDLFEKAAGCSPFTGSSQFRT